MKNENHCKYSLDVITLISVSRQGMLLLFEIAYKYFDQPTHQKIHLYVYIYISIILHFILFLHFTFFYTPPKMLRMF